MPDQDVEEAAMDQFYGELYRSSLLASLVNIMSRNALIHIHSN